MRLCSHLSLLKTEFVSLDSWCGCLSQGLPLWDHFTHELCKFSGSRSPAAITQDNRLLKTEATHLPVRCVPVLFALVPTYNRAPPLLPSPWLPKLPFSQLSAKRPSSQAGEMSTCPLLLYNAVPGNGCHCSPHLTYLSKMVMFFPLLCYELPWPCLSSEHPCKGGQCSFS